MRSFVDGMVKDGILSSKTINTAIRRQSATPDTFQAFADRVGLKYTELHKRLNSGADPGPVSSGTQDSINSNLSGRWKGTLFQTEGPSADLSYYFEIELFVINNGQGGTDAVVCYERKNGEIRHSAGADIFLRSVVEDTGTFWIFRRWAHQRFERSKDIDNRKARPKARQSKDDNVPRFYWWKISPVTASNPPKLNIEIELQTSYQSRLKTVDSIMWKGSLSLHQL